MNVTVPLLASDSFKQFREERNAYSASGSSLSYTENKDLLNPELVGYIQPRQTNKISILRAVVVFLNQNIGVGLLSIPFCFRTGVILNSLVLALLAFFGISSFILLVDVSVATGQSIDYAKFIRFSFPNSKYNLDWFPLTIIFITLLGCIILHFQYACTMIQTFFDELCDLGLAQIPKWAYNRWLLIGVPSLVIDLPLVFLRSIKALSYASLFTLVLIIIYIIHCIYIFILDMKLDSNASNIMNSNHSPMFTNTKFEGLTYFSFNSYFIPSLSIQAFAFTFNMMVAPTIEKLKNPTRKRQYTTFGLVIAVSCITYIFCGLLPYMALIPNIDHAIVFEDFVHGRIFTIIMKALFGVFLIMTTPLILFSCRVAFNDATFKSEFTLVRWNIMGVCILIVATVIAAAVESITTVFGFIGGVTSTTTAYVLPSIYYLRICSKESLAKTFLSWFMLPTGIVILSVCLYDSIRSIIAGDGAT